MKTALLLGFATLTLGVLASASCGDSGTTSTSTTGSGGSLAGCTTDPYGCKAGQTCWPNDDLSVWQCSNSGKGVAGDPCELIGGEVTCGDGLICVASATATDGICSPYCDATDSDHPCPDAEPCGEFLVKGGSSAVTIHVCVPGSSMTTSSTGVGGSSSTSTSTSSSTTTTTTTTTDASSTSSEASSSSSASTGSGTGGATSSTSTG